jgi:hypothetical protein
MRLRASLHDDPAAGRLGILEVLDATGRVLYGPLRVRGEADNAAAAAHGNPGEDPTGPFGDHPFGTSEIIAVKSFWPPDPHYGTAFLVLEPRAGQILEAYRRGRTGIGIHDGSQMPDGSLRATFGCLRLPEGQGAWIGAMVLLALRMNQTVTYEAVEALRA